MVDMTCIIIKTEVQIMFITVLHFVIEAKTVPTK